jgi:hypothetical protein
MEPLIVRTSDCREWQGAKQSRGYGVRSVAGRLMLVHRWVWEQVNGPIPPGMYVLHHCDNPPLYSMSRSAIEHIKLGTTWNR